MITSDPLQLGEIVLRTAVVYGVLLLLLRLAGKRELGQMSLFDLIVILIIANSVQNAMVGTDSSLNGGLIAALVLITLNWLINRIGLQFGWLGRKIMGTPTLLVNDGTVLETQLRKEGVSADELAMALRQHGVEKPQDARLVVLEVDGTISVIPRHASIQRTRHRLRDR